MRQINSATVVAAPRLVLCVLLAILFAPSARAQKPNDKQFPKFEFFGAYSSIETNNHTFHFGSNFNIINTDFDEGGRGFEAGATRNLNRYVGVMGDFSAHFSHDQGPTNFTITPCAQPPCTVTQLAKLNPRLFDFVAGPEFKWRNRTRFTPFAHALYGMAYTTATFKTASPALTLSRNDADKGFAMAYGGGLEIRIVRHVSLRISIDYRKAFVGSSALPPQRVNAIGFSVGIVFH